RRAVITTRIISQTQRPSAVCSAAAAVDFEQFLTPEQFETVDTDKHHFYVKGGPLVYRKMRLEKAGARSAAISTRRESSIIIRHVMNGRLHDPQQGKEDEEGKEKLISSTLWRINDHRQRALNTPGLTRDAVMSPPYLCELGI
ncbi:hypothetical protein DMN91_004523, partial [Ooceraea biroi]